jgi:hypothetical protein
MPQQPDEWPVTASVRLYSLLLSAYPKAFKRDYSQSMLQVFRDCCRDVYIRDGAFGLMSLWMRTLGDLAMSVPKERAAIGTARPAAVRTRLVIA